MAQIIKHRRGSLESLSTVTGSLQKGEIVIASGSTNLTASNGNSIAFIVPADGTVQATNRIIRGTTAPNVFPASTYNGMLNGVPYYASASAILPTLYLLGGGANEAIDLVGNIQPFSASVATSINALSASIGSGTIGTSVNLLNTFSASVLTQLSTLGTYTSSLETKNSALATITGSLISTASANVVSITNINTETASIESRLSTLATYTSSLETRMSEIATETSSLETRATQIGVVTGSLITSASNAAVAIANLNGASGSYAKLSGGNIFTGQQVISGSLYITTDLVVYGSSSIQNVSASAVSIGTNIVQLNTANPAIRFAGLTVIDSGSTGATGSLLWDSQHNRWLYSQPSDSGAPYNSAILINGPENSGSLGSEQTLTAGYIPVAQADDHIMNSQIQDNGTTVSIAGNLDLTGSMKSPQLNAIATITGSLISTASANTVSIANLNTLTASALVRFSNLEITSASVNTSIENLNSFTSSNNSTTLLNAFTASAESRFTTLASVTASLIVDTNNLEVFSASVLTQLSTLETETASIESRLTTIQTLTASYDSRFTALATVSGSLISSASAAKTTNDSQDVSITNLNTVTSSALVRLSNLETTSASVNTSVSNINTFTSSANSRITVLEGTGTIQGVGTTNDVTFNKVTTTSDVIVGGDLVVQGNTVTLNTATLVVEDKLISLASGSTNAATANGAGIEVLGASATITYQSTPDAWQFNKPITGSAVTASLNVPSGGGNSKRIAFRGTTDNIEFVTAPTTTGDLVQWDGTNFVMSNTIDGGSF